MSSPENYEKTTDNQPSYYDSDESFIAASYKHKHKEDEGLTIFYQPYIEEQPYVLETALGTIDQASSKRKAIRKANRHMEDHPNGFEGLPADAQITFTLGSPVKTQEYYSVSSGDFEEHDLERPLYGRGTATGGGEVRHNSDLRRVQASSSTVMFVYSDGGELGFDELKEVVEKQSAMNVSRFDEIYFYRDGRRIPALKSGTRDANKRTIKRMTKDFEESDVDPNLTPEQAEDAGSLSIFT